MSSCLVIAGEKSGEEHLMSFFSELKLLCPNTNFYGVGGDEFSRRGGELIYHLKDFSSMGFSEVILKLPFYFNAIKRLQDEVKLRKTKTAILIDFQDFNLRLAKKLSENGVKVLYYVAPQAWAWKPNRAQVLSKTVHTLFTILPFEKKWFKDRGVNQVLSIPHPLMTTYKDELEWVPYKDFKLMKKMLKLLILPGSRRSEVFSLLPRYMDTVRLLKKTMSVEVHLVKVNNIPNEIYDYYRGEVDFVYPSEQLTIAMKSCHIAIAASGTVTLSTALFELPTIVCYKTSLLNEFIFYNLVNYQGSISLTNIIHQKILFPELVQEYVNPYLIYNKIRSWTEDENRYNEIVKELKKTKKMLSGDHFSVSDYISKVLNE